MEVTVDDGTALRLQEVCANYVSMQHRGSSEFVTLFMTITVGIASFVVLLRVLFTLFPLKNGAVPTLSAIPGIPTSATSASSATAGPVTPTTVSSHPPLTKSSSVIATPLKRHSSVKDRLEMETRAVLPRRSTYYTMPFFADTLANKQEFIESLIELGDDVLDGWLLVKKSSQRGKNWKKRYVVLDGNGRIKYYPNAEAARRNTNIKGSVSLHAVKPADPLEFGANTLEVRGTLGGTYFFRAEDDMAARKWLCVMTKRAIQSRIPGRIDSHLSAAVVNAASGVSSATHNSKDLPSPADGFFDGMQILSATGDASTPPSSLPLKTHALEAFVEDMSYGKEAALRQFYVVVKFKSELHDHSGVPVGQTVPKACERGVVSWQEQLRWYFTDHNCAECVECCHIGSTYGTFCGLPDIMVVHVYEIHLRYLTTKIGEMAISLREMFGFTGMKEAQIHCAWPVTSTHDSILGQLSLKLNYTVDNAGGTALVPFLVTSENEREFIGEYAIHPSVKTVTEFFDLFYANGTSERWREYHKARGDTEMEIGEWRESKEYGGRVRVITCRSLTNASIGPSSTMNTTTHHAFFSESSSGEPEKFTLESTVFLHDIPYGDCFTVEQVTVVERGTSGNLVAKVYLGIPFSKGCMFKSKIISATKEGVISSSKLCYDLLNKSLDGSPSAVPPPAPTTPFLVTTEEERQVLGEYSVHSYVKDAMHYFDLFYANNTFWRWEGVIKQSGDTEHDISEWMDSPEYGGQIRTIKYRAKTNSSFGPSTTAATQIQHVLFNSNRENADLERFVLEQKMMMHDIPYGDCFSIEIVYVVDRDVDGRLSVKAFISVPFSKHTMFKSKITSATKEGVQKTQKPMFDELWKALDKEIVTNRDSSSGRGSMISDGNDSVRPSEGGQVIGKTTPPRKAMLVRYNSTLDGSVALEEIFENQRVSIFGKWGPNHLLPTDRPRFSNRNGDVALSFEQVTLPPNWIWTTPWKIDKSYTDCDDEGWSYATDFPRFKSHLARGKSSVKRLGASVRRRRWIRMMCYVPPEAGANTTSGAPNGEGSNTQMDLSNPSPNEDVARK